MLKKIWLTLLMAIAAIPLATAANVVVDGIKYTTSTDGTAYVSGLADGNNATDIVILESIEVEGVTYTVNRIADHAFYNKNEINSITFSKAITSIGYSAFGGCSSLTSIGDMQLVTTIEDYAFNGCSSLATMGDLSSVNGIGENAFNGCNSLTSIGDMPSLTIIGFRAFNGCSRLTTIGDMPSLDGIGNYAFNGCSSLTTIGDMSSLTKISTYAFSGCRNLTTIGDMSSLTTIGSSLFSGYSSLQSIGDLSSCISIGSYAFGGCSSLTTIGDMLSLKSIGNDAFRNCSSLQSVGDLPACTSIGSDAFQYCSSLQSVGDLSSCTSIGTFAFDGCSSLKSIGNLSSCTSIGSYAFRDILIEDFYLSSSVQSITTSAFSRPTAVHFSTVTPPAFTGTSFSTFVYVPAEGYDAYAQALPDNAPNILLKEGVPTSYDFTVSAQDSSSDVLAKLNRDSEEDLAYYVFDLKVKGSINSYDIMVMRNKMLNLRTLDLSEATIVANPYEYYSGCHTEDNVIGGNMFRKLNMTNVILPKDITKIGGYAFHDCEYLTEIRIPEGVTSIAGYAFYGCDRLKNIKLPSSLFALGAYTFYYCLALESIVIPPLVEEIPYNCFQKCNSLTSVSLPPTLKKIGEGAFDICPSLLEFRIPAGVVSIGNKAVPSSVRDVYTYTIQPTKIGQSTFDSDAYLKATLHVPETSEYLYYWDTQWSQFQSIKNFNEPYTYFYLDDKDLVENPDTPRIDGEIDDETGEKKNPDADLGQGSGLVVEGDESQDLGNVDINHDGNGNGTSIIGGDSDTSESGGNINIDMLNININVAAGKWYFFSFPFDVKCSDIKFNGQMVWRYYDGEWRAMYGSGAWKDNKEDYLRRGKGYIFQGSKAGTLTLSIPNASFDAQDWHMELEQNVSEMAQDASWNFIGNPFQSYYELADLGFEGPITWWNPATKSYEAFSPLDDDMTLYPFMAFFVQKPEGVESVGFDAEYRETNNQKNDKEVMKAACERRRVRRAAAGADSRQLVNLSVTGLAGSDRTRVVFNSDASPLYEVGVDASKFISTDAPQLYTLDAANVRYAINERPLGDGSVRMGFMAPESGVYAIECARTDCAVTLKDLKTGKSVELKKGTVYEFTADKGDDEGRFMICAKAPGSNAVENVDAVETDAIYYDINGLKSDGSQHGVKIQLGNGVEAKKVIK